jgi:dTDP-4-amino-4,6-dideoxygalactose transaminase
MPPYRQYLGAADAFPAADHISARGISLPSSIDLDEEAIFRISVELSTALNKQHGR